MDSNVCVLRSLYRPRQSSTAPPFLLLFPLFVSFFLSATFHEPVHHAGWDERLIEREGMGLKELSVDLMRDETRVSSSHKYT